MKVLLINPPRENELTGFFPSFIGKDLACYPPLGILYVASYLLQYSHHAVEIIDAFAEQLNHSLLEKKIRLISPEIVGITVTTLTIIDVLKTVALVKAINSHIIIVLGGPHVQFFPEETISKPGVDFLVVGEGEKSFFELVNCLDKSNNIEHIKNIAGLVLKIDGKIIKTPCRPPCENLDELPFPARQLTKINKYRSLLGSGNKLTSIFTSRGCPFECAFCDRPQLGRSWRARTAINIIKEIETCLELGITDFQFYDDTFTVSKKRTIGFCKEVIKRKLRITWNIRTRIDTVDEEMLFYLKKAGCRAIHYGIEASSNRVLDALKKNITVEQAKKVVEMTKRNKISVLVYFMIGNPKEKREDVIRTFSLIKQLKADYAHISIFSPLPHTSLYFDALKSGVIKRDIWRGFSENPTADFVMPYWGENFTGEELKKLMIQGYRDCYLHPYYIFKRILQVRTISQFIKLFRIGLRFLGLKNSF